MPRAKYESRAAARAPRKAKGHAASVHMLPGPQSKADETMTTREVQAIRKRTENWIDYIPKKAKAMRRRLTYKRVRQFFKRLLRRVDD